MLEPQRPFVSVKFDSVGRTHRAPHGHEKRFKRPVGGVAEQTEERDVGRTVVTADGGEVMTSCHTPKERILRRRELLGRISH